MQNKFFYGFVFTIIFIGVQAFIIPGNKTNLKVFELKEIRRIGDAETEDLFFKSPSKIRIGEDNSIYVLDKKQLLKIKEGKVLNNYYKEGRGPGEFTQVSGFDLGIDSIVVYSPEKVAWFKNDGSFLKEIGILSKGFPTFLGFSQGRIIFGVRVISGPVAEDSIINQQYRILALDISGKFFEYETLIDVPTYISAKGYMRMPLRDNILSGCFGSILFWAGDVDYKIRGLDLENDKNLFLIAPEYLHVKMRKDLREKRKNTVVARLGSDVYYAPDKEYSDDIQNLLMNQGKLWVVTSTTDRQNGVFIDVYDMNGKMADQFILSHSRKEFFQNLSDGKIAVKDKDVYIIEKNENDDYFIVQYRMEDRKK